ncbi:zinc dependent phospholipase C family protein [Paenibacillus endoradicis]|uniref:zinc dependent phospholipase C family protein n=1 Tax=Paenibacillus endoradicis TaxID=2972487 RepID=UPI002159625D|nr:zinc dependent phospholipase C family protein [Paenibacillus endoradicis]MCR8656657.1 zinc dependent phospholipase C family protein [Paenibacillus endoradicis]
MGSRIMHLVIANRISECLELEDRTSFLLGSIAPDAVSPKDLSHFFEGRSRDYSRFINYNRFLDNYSSYRESHYILGYYTHLIADDIWLKGFFLSWLRNRMDADKDLINLYHNDFRLLNGKLLEYYGYTDQLKRMLSERPAILDIEEVKSTDVEQFIPYVFGDIAYNKEDINENLNVFTLNQIIGYIETSVELGLLKLKPIISALEYTNNFKEIGGVK